MAKKIPENPILANNKKAHHDYTIVEKFEAGIKLSGTEVKSCRARAVNMNEGYIRISKGEAILLNVHIATYSFGNRFNHDTLQMRKLLLHKNEILKLSHRIGSKGGTIVPLKMYLKGGLIKLEIGYCLGKTHGDQRDDMRKKDSDMEIKRMVKRM